ncbi:MAG: hypothetical protein LBF62_11815 [Tannerellaceae bacterium]|nr:hypothetical protein [Tannerellaceae bacterium]
MNNRSSALCERGGQAPRKRLTGGGFKPRRAALVKSYGRVQRPKSLSGGRQVSCQREKSATKAGLTE